MRQASRLAPALGLLGNGNEKADHGRHGHGDVIAEQSGPARPRIARQRLQPGRQYPGVDARGEQQQRALEAQRDAPGPSTEKCHQDCQQRPQDRGGNVRQHQAAAGQYVNEAERRVVEEVAAADAARFR